jgi:hypothetical protein
MKSYHNIDKHPLYAGRYIGYSDSGAWRITKRPHGWSAIELAHDKKGYFFCRTLAEVSAKLAK